MIPSLGVAGGPPPCLPSLYRDKCEAGWVSSHRAVESDAWLRVAEKLSLCRKPESPSWMGGIDKLGEKPAWAHPCGCGYRFCDDCATETVTEAIGYLDLLRKDAGERALGVFLFTYRNCGHEACRDEAWYRCLADVRRWRDWMRHDYGLSAIQFVATVEEHKTHWPHVHMVARLLPSQTREVKLVRKGKEVFRTVAAGAEMRAARARWKEISGAWTCFWEVAASRPEYIAKYLTKLARLPEPIKAFLFCNRRRLYSKSNYLTYSAAPPSRYNIVRGTKDFVIARTGVNITPPEVGARHLFLEARHGHRAPELTQDRIG